MQTGCEAVQVWNAAPAVTEQESAIAPACFETSLHRSLQRHHAGDVAVRAAGRFLDYLEMKTGEK